MADTSLVVGNGTVAPTRPGALVRQGFDGSVEVGIQSAAAVALAEREKAELQSMFVMAERNPRSWDGVRHRLLDHSKRYKWADSAIWELPRGGETITGPSIRLAEAVAQEMGNLYVDTQVTLDTEHERRVKVIVIDTERRIRAAREVAFPKTVERRRLPKDYQGDPPPTRRNSYGNLVYIMPATDQEVLEKQNSALSRALRTELLRLLPPDILEEVLETCEATLKAGMDKDPSLARKKVVDSFASVGVIPEQLEAYLGHPLAQLVPAEHKRLRGIYQAIQQSQTTWAKVMAEKDEALKPENVKSVAPPPPHLHPDSTVEALKAAGAKINTPAAPPVPSKPAEHPSPVAQPISAGGTPAVFDPGPHDPVTGEVMEDALSVEVKALSQAIAKAKTKEDLRPLSPRIRALPPDDRDALTQVYAKRLEELV